MRIPCIFHLDHLDSRQDIQLYNFGKWIFMEEQLKLHNWSKGAAKKFGFEVSFWFIVKLYPTIFYPLGQFWEQVPFKFVTRGGLNISPEKQSEQKLVLFEATIWHPGIYAWMHDFVVPFREKPGKQSVQVKFTSTDLQFGGRRWQTWEESPAKLFEIVGLILLGQVSIHDPLTFKV